MISRGEGKRMSDPEFEVTDELASFIGDLHDSEINGEIDLFLDYNRHRSGWWPCSGIKAATFWRSGRRYGAGSGRIALAVCSALDSEKRARLVKWPEPRPFSPLAKQCRSPRLHRPQALLTEQG
jgi:hypothetical protein